VTLPNPALSGTGRKRLVPLHGIRIAMVLALASASTFLLLHTKGTEGGVSG
jgi:hypothetical protein